MARFENAQHPRGVALLMVMVAMVVGLILTAGFLATQSTANGIVRNQRSIGQTRMIAEAGIDSCVWLIKNKSDWRRTMTPGAWISNMALSGGTLSVNVTDGAGNASFVTDNTQPALLQSTATYNGETVTLRATITPSGGGLPWQNGLFVNSGPTLQNTASIDAYNPLAGLYPLSKLLTAIVGTGGTGSGCSNGCGGACGSGCGCGNSGCGTTNVNCQGGLVESGTSSVVGTVVGIPGNLLQTLLGGLLTTQPSVVTTAPETRTLGTVVEPNTAGFTAGGAFSKSSTVSQPTTGQAFSSFAIMKPTGFGTSQMVASTSAVYLVNGNFTLDQSSTIKVPTGVTVTFVVLGNSSIQGTVLLQGTGQFLLYTNGTVNIYGAASFNGQSTSGQALILGLPGSTSITIGNTAIVAAGIYAPKAVVQMSSSAVLYGSVVAQSLELSNSSAAHMDTTIASRAFHQIYGGTTEGDYTVTWTRSNGSN